jgi:beta-lactamase regulating signal transducer with metallopeptidase domain
MSAPLAWAAEANLAASAAILLALALRKPAARRLGPHAAYSLWLVVPAALLATLLPARTIISDEPAAGMDAFISALPSAGTTALLLIWIAGAAATAAALIRRQQAFAADVRQGRAGPAVVGFLDPEIVLPADFRTRFTLAEQRLVLAHEEVHLDRHDTRINTAVAALRCLFWFNPLVHVGAQAMRTDQETSCDAAVIDRRPLARRLYAETLLKSELAARPLPAGCYWPADPAHPLTTRIALLARPPAPEGLRLAAGFAITALAATAGYGAWTAQPARHAAPPVEAASPAPEMLISVRLGDASDAATLDTAPPPLRVRFIAAPTP